MAFIYCHVLLVSITFFKYQGLKLCPGFKSSVFFSLTAAKKPRGRPERRKKRRGINPFGRKGRGTTTTPTRICQQTPAHLSARSIKVESLFCQFR